jgi:hypothetical protein
VSRKSCVHNRVVLIDSIRWQREKEVRRLIKVAGCGGCSAEANLDEWVGYRSCHILRGI